MGTQSTERFLAAHEHRELHLQWGATCQGSTNEKCKTLERRPRKRVSQDRPGPRPCHSPR